MTFSGFWVERFFFKRLQNFFCWTPLFDLSLRSLIFRNFELMWAKSIEFICCCKEFICCQNSNIWFFIEICTNELFKESETVESLSKTDFKELLSLATKDSHFIFDGTLYKQIDGVAMGSPLGPTLANAFLVYHEKNWLEHCPVE